MQNNHQLQKWLAVGAILLFIMASVIPTAMHATSVKNSEKNLFGKDTSTLRGNITVTITFPENGVYWNDHKIMPFSVPFVLHGLGAKRGFFVRITPVEFSISGNAAELEVYWNGVSVGNVTSPPWTFGGVPMTFFSCVTVKIIAYGYQGDSGSDEITIYRLFL